MNYTIAIDWATVKARVAESQAAIYESLALADCDRLQQVFRDRARQLAARETTAARRADAQQALTFAVGSERYCLAIGSVGEVLPYARCSPIPGAQTEVLGVVNVRGQICSVLDLARILGLPEIGDRSQGYIVLVRHGDAEVGLRVDEVEQVEAMSSDELISHRGDLAATSQYTHSRTAAGVAVLDLDAVFSHPVFGPSLDAARRPSGASHDDRHAAVVSLDDSTFLGDLR